MSHGFLDLPPELEARETAAAVILPVPYDGTSSFHKGADRGPAAMIAASGAIEWWDQETGWEPCRAGIATAPPIAWDGPPEGLVPRVRDAAGAILDEGRMPVVLGGEHTVTVGAFEAAADRVPGIGVLQIDAHGDTRDEYEGSRYNHACVMARVHERAASVQVGIRAIDASERATLSPHTFWAHEIAAACDDAWMDRVVDALPESVYLTIDLDALDPSLLPATGTPEPGGLGWYDVVRLVDKVAAARRIVAFDVVELCPMPGQVASEFTAAKLVHRVLAAVLPRPAAHQPST